MRTTLKTLELEKNTFSKTMTNKELRDISTNTPSHVIWYDDKRRLDNYGKCGDYVVQIDWKVLTTYNKIYYICDGCSFKSQKAVQKHVAIREYEKANSVIIGKHQYYSDNPFFLLNVEIKSEED